MSPIVDDRVSEEIGLAAGAGGTQLTQESRNVTQYQTEDGQPNIALLEDRMPVALQASRSSTVLVAVLGITFLVMNFYPLWHTDLWGHLSYGRWIIENGQLPATEPLMPLAEGVPMVNTAWGSQVLGYLTFQQFGVAGIQFSYAFSILLVSSLLTGAVYFRTRSHWFALLTFALFYWCDYQQLIIVRPQLAGMVCFAAVFVMATSVRWRTWYLAAIPLTFAIWANLHGSFIVGLVMLGALLVGRALDVLRRSRNWKMIFSETRTRQIFYALELSAIAVMLNPYGIGIYPAVLEISGHVNLLSLIEWDPLTLRMKQGQAFAALVIGLMIVYRLSPRRVSAGEVLLLIGLGLSSLWTSRMIVWWAPVAAYYIGLHSAASWNRFHKNSPVEIKRGGLYTVANLGLLWIFFAYSPLGGTILHGGPATPEEARQKFQRAVSTATPLEAANYLREHPPSGLVFNSYDWGDYLIWAGPPELKLFVASHVHLIPAEVWMHYREVSQGGVNWQSRLDRYGVNTVVINPVKHNILAERLKESSAIWTPVYESKKTAVYQRINSI